MKTKKEIQKELEDCKKLLKDVHEISLRIKWSPSEVGKWIEVEKQLGIKSDEFAF